MIDLTPSFLKSSVFKPSSVCRHENEKPVFSDSAGLLRFLEGVVWTAGPLKMGFGVVWSFYLENFCCMPKVLKSSKKMFLRLFKLYQKVVS